MNAKCILFTIPMHANAHYKLTQIQFMETRLRGDLIEVYKIVTGKYDPEVCEGLIVRRDDDRSTGHLFRIFKERANREVRKNSFPHRVIDTWNKRRMGEVVKADTVKEFEFRLDSVLGCNVDLFYNYKATIKYMHMKNVMFESATLESEEQQDE